MLHQEKSVNGTASGFCLKNYGDVSVTFCYNMGAFYDDFLISFKATNTNKKTLDCIRGLFVSEERIDKNRMVLTMSFMRFVSTYNK